ncbi:hypothetical protein [Puniceibacterium sediminis]|nr:hypothetical protein [Puniceibacterium sediminis]
MQNIPVIVAGRHAGRDQVMWQYRLNRRVQNKTQRLFSQGQGDVYIK